MKKYVKDDNNMKYYVDKNNKLTYKGAMDMLKLEGLKCEKQSHKNETIFYVKKIVFLIFFLYICKVFIVVNKT